MMVTHKTLNLSAGAASVTVALTLVAIKLWALGETTALSIAASLIDSALDLVVSLAGVLAIFYAARPADDDHAFGHTSAEDPAALAQSILVTVSAIIIVWSAITRLLSGTSALIMSETRGIVAMLISIALTIALVLFQRRVAAKTGNRVVTADSLHYLSDLLPNVAAIIALAAAAAFGLTSIDSAVALAAALFLLVSAWRIGKPAFDALMDRRADPAIIAKISEIAVGWQGVQGFHDLKTRTAGNRIFVQIHIELDGAQTLNEAHTIGASLRREILNALPNAEVIIHKDPVRD